jgi:hypothetical protein
VKTASRIAPDIKTARIFRLGTAHGLRSNPLATFGDVVQKNGSGSFIGSR